MKTFAIVVLKRHDLTEAVVGLRGKEDDARRSAWEIAVAMADEIIRCRVQPMDLTVEQIKAICFRWGQEDARSGEPVVNELPGVYGQAYRAGFTAASWVGPGGGH